MKIDTGRWTVKLGNHVLGRLDDDDARQLLERHREKNRRDFEGSETRHLILTSTEGTTNRFCGLTLLQPGLGLADISCLPVPFRPEDAQPPELPSPSPAKPTRRLTEPVSLPSKDIEIRRSPDSALSLLKL